jgi:hypothetical protein
VSLEGRHKEFIGWKLKKKKKKERRGKKDETVGMS